MPKVIASECYAGLFPQNSFSGFKYCVDEQAANGHVDGIEFDVHLSADGHVVVQHDYFLNKRITRNAEGNRIAGSGPPICKRSLADLKHYDIGRYKDDCYEAQEYPQYQPIDGEQIPTLDEFLKYYTQIPGTADARRDATTSAQLWIELKTSPLQRGSSSNPIALLDAVLALVDKYEVSQHCVLLAFEWDVLQRAQTLNSEVQTNFLSVNSALMRSLNQRNANAQGEVDIDLWYGALAPVDEENIWQAVVRGGGEWWGPYVKDASVENVARAQAAGLKVNVWGVNSNTQDIQNALDLGADTITLGRPDLVANGLSV